MEKPWLTKTGLNKMMKSVLLVGLMLSSSWATDLKAQTGDKMKTKFGYYGSLRAKDGERTALAEILLQAAEVVKELPGCRIYLINMDNVDPDLLRITEVWDSKQDQLASLGNDEVRELIGKAMPLMTEEQEKGIEMTVVGGLGPGF